MQERVEGGELLCGDVALGKSAQRREKRLAGVVEGVHRPGGGSRRHPEHPTVGRSSRPHETG